MKINITIQQDNKVEHFEADKAAIVNQNGDKITLNAYNSSDTDVIGLLEVGKWHVKRDWEKTNSAS